MSKIILREYVKTILQEDDDGGYYYDDYYGGSGEGLSGMKAIFVDPFLDVFKTGKKAVADISSKAQYLIGGALASIAASVVPFMDVEWGELKKAEEQRQERLLQKYGDVLKKTDEALFTDDAVVMQFLYNPYAFITGFALKKSPAVALETLRTLFGERLPTTTSKGNKFDIKGTLKKAMLGGALSLEGKSKENVINEGVLDTLKKYLAGDDVKKAIEGSAKAKQMKKDAELLAKEKVNSIVQAAKKSLNVESTKALDKLSDGKFSSAMKKVPQNEKVTAAAHVADKTQRMIKSFFINKLKEEMGKLPNELKKIYEHGIQQIHKL